MIQRCDRNATITVNAMLFNCWNLVKVKEVLAEILKAMSTKHF